MGVQAVRRGASAGGLGAPPGACTPLSPGAGARKLSAANLNGTEIAYDVVGEGPAVVLLHAGVGDRRLWDGQVDALAAHHCVVRPDFRGCGDSPLPGGPFSHVDDIRALLDHLEIDRAALVGNSLGGRVAIDLVLEQPERVWALVPVASALTGYVGSAELDALDEEEEAFLDAGELDEAVELNLRTWLDGLGRAAAPVPAEVRRRVEEMYRRLLEIDLAAYKREPPPGPISWSEPPAMTRLNEIAAPTLVVACTHDQPDFRRIAGLLVDGIPDAEGTDMETAHLPGIERPDELNRVLLDFLSRSSG